MLVCDFKKTKTTTKGQRLVWLSATAINLKPYTPCYRCYLETDTLINVKNSFFFIDLL